MNPVTKESPSKSYQQHPPTISLKAPKYRRVETIKPFIEVNFGIQAEVAARTGC